MQVTNQIKDKAKSFTILSTTSNISLKAITSSFWALVSNNNTFFLCLSNLFRGIIIAMSQNFDVEILWLINKGKYLSCKEKRYTILNFSEKAKVSTIINSSYEDILKNVD